MKTLKAVLVATAVLMLLIGVQTAQASVPYFAMQLSDGIPGDTVTVLDGSVLDLSGAPGVIDGIIVYSGSVGVDWIINVTTGVTYPVLGSITAPRLDLNSINVSSGNGGSLDLQLSAQGFTTPGGAEFLIGGTTGGTVDANAYFSSSNNLLAETTKIAELGPFGAGAFSGTASGAVFGATPYSLTLDVNITHVGSDVTSFNSSLSVPEPGTLMLLGLGLFGFGIARKKIS